MKVSHTGNNNVQNTEVGTAKRSGKTSKTSSELQINELKGRETGSSDAVKSDLSAKSKEYARARAIANKAPDVREEKIAELKRRIASGEYTVDANKVADRLVDEHIKMHGIG